MKIFSLKSFLIFVVSLTLQLFSSTSNAQTFTKLNVKGRVQIEIPDDWTINDAEHRKRVKLDRNSSAPRCCSLRPVLSCTIQDICSSFFYKFRSTDFYFRLK